MIEVREFKAEHYVELMKGKCVANLDTLGIGKVYELGKGMAYSGFHMGKLIACAGVMIPWPGMGEMWAVIDHESVSGCVLSFSKAAQRVLWGVYRNMGLKRIQVNVDAKSGVAIRWVRWLGFRFEGEMEKYGPNGEDFMRFVMFPQNGKGEY